jgi:ubiquinone/menaquinone biosynthesis C-methylase UbiE
MAQEWQSYDSAAVTHDRVSVPSAFAPPARDLVARIGLPATGTILDVGTGSGVAALLAMESTGPGTTIVGLDPSLEMLRVARSHGLPSLVAGAVPGLPFADGSFDRVLASFVLNHVTSFHESLLDMARVLRPGGRLGVTAWGSIQNEFRQAWQSRAESFVGKEAFQAGTQMGLPWDDWFADAAHLRQAFQEAGFAAIEMHYHIYEARMTIEEFLAMRDASLQGRFMRGALEDPQWDQFKRALSEEFYRRFKDPIEHSRDVNIAIGTRRSWWSPYDQMEHRS